jgi:hypothetical protein
VFPPVDSVGVGVVLSASEDPTDSAGLAGDTVVSPPLVPTGALSADAGVVTCASPLVVEPDGGTAIGVQTRTEPIVVDGVGVAREGSNDDVANEASERWRT